MIELTLGIIFGGIVSWCLTHIYYRKSSKEIPDWAKPIIEKLPKTKPSGAELLELFQDALDSKQIIPDPILGHVACPNCKAPSSDFETKCFGDENHTIIVKSCPHCGWSDHAEV
jgi:hypothetical protein